MLRYAVLLDNIALYFALEQVLELAISLGYFTSANAGAGSVTNRYVPDLITYLRF
jgi:hypothetical protein